MQKEEFRGRLVSYSNFTREIRAIRRLYLITVFTYEEKANQIRQDKLDLKITSATEFYFRDELIARSPYEINSKLTERYPSIFREFLFIRVMSLLETFFYDTLYEIAQMSNVPFRTNNKERTYKLAELLSIDDIMEIKQEIIGSEIRSVISQGYREINRFFDRRLNTKFSDSGLNLKRLELMYDKRNLLVHNNGIIDDTFIHKHNYLERSRRIIIQEDFLLEALDLLQKLTLYIYRSIDDQFDLVPRKIKDRKKQSGVIHDDIIIEEEYKASFINSEYKEILLNDNFSFGFTGKYLFSEIKVTVIDLSDYEAQWTVRGSKKIIGEYRGFIRKAKRQEKFRSLEFMKVRTEEN